MTVFLILHTTISSLKLPESRKIYFFLRFCTDLENKEELIHTEPSINSKAKSLALHHFHLKQGDEVRTEITATNKAMTPVTSSSTGFKVDLTDPILVALVDGPDLSKDPMFTVSEINIQIKLNSLLPPNTE